MSTSMADNPRTNLHGRDGEASDHTLHDGNDNQQEADSGEKGQHDGPPKPVGFWNGSLNRVRLSVFKNWALTVLILCSFIIAILSLYWAALFNVDQNLTKLIVHVVSFESEPNALVGPLVTDMTEGIVKRDAMPHLGFITIPSANYNNDPMAVRDSIYNEDAYAAIVVNANATTLLRQAVEQGNTSYDPLGAMQLIYVQARDESTYSNYVLPQLNSLQTEIISSFGSMWAGMVLSNTSIPRSNLEQVPQALSPAIGFSTYNLRPFTPPVTTPAVTVGLIYLIIIAFFSFAFFLPIHMKFIKPEGHPPLHFYQLIIWRWISTIVAYAFMSLSYSLVSLAFQIHFSRPSAPHTIVADDANAYGRGSFVVYWMLNFVGMASLGLPCENVAMIIGQPWTSLWLIFWVITNVSTSFYSIDTAPGFFRWGYAWPLHNIVTASRTIIFDVRSEIGLNFGVLFAWAAVSTILFPACCWFMRWKTMRAQKKSQ